MFHLTGLGGKKPTTSGVWRNFTFLKKGYQVTFAVNDWMPLARWQRKPYDLQRCAKILHCAWWILNTSDRPQGPDPYWYRGRSRKTWPEQIHWFHAKVKSFHWIGRLEKVHSVKSVLNSCAGNTSAHSNSRYFQRHSLIDRCTWFQYTYIYMYNTFTI